MPPPEPGDLAGLVAEVGRFYIRNRAMRKAQDRIAAALAADERPSADESRAYLNAVRTYFAGFEREARAHLADLDRRLAKASQLQFNLTAERGVTQRRVEVTQGVLQQIEELATR
jgi:hypothetical protein